MSVLEFWVNSVSGNSPTLQHFLFGFNEACRAAFGSDSPRLQMIVSTRGKEINVLLSILMLPG